MDEAVNPLIPAPYDLIWSGMVAVMFALMVAAIVSVVRHAKHLSALAYVLWILVVLSLPLLGSALWFAFGRQAVRQKSVASAG